LEKKVVQIVNKSTRDLKFSLTAINAQNDDRLAYDSLRKWAKDLSNSYHGESQRISMRIKEYHEIPPSDWLTEPRISGVDWGEIKFSAATKLFSQRNTNERVDIIKTIGYRKLGSTKERMMFMLDVVEKDPSLRAVAEAGSYLTYWDKIIDASILDIDGILEWKRTQGY